MGKAIAVRMPPGRLFWLAPLAVFVAVLAVLVVLNRGSAPDPLASLDEAALSRDTVAGPTGERIAALQDAIRAEPDVASSYAQLGDAYMQRARETADPAYYARAEDSFAAALRLDPDELTATIGQGSLALARHDFSAALALGQLAHRIEPDLVRPYTVIADAQIELGQYDAASRTLDRLVSLKPTLAAYSRVSYFRELNGDLPGAVDAMRLATSAGGGSVEASTYVESLLGKLEIDRGRYGAARQAYGRALALDPEYAPALAGLARLDAAAGEFEPAIRSLRDVVARLPLPEYAIQLGETELAAGRKDAAARDFALVGVEAELLAQNGVDTDSELAIFEADHGNAARAVELGRAGWENAPSVRSADALAWALHADGRDAAAQSFSERAMSLGSRDPAFLYRAGIVARDAGESGIARDLLGGVAAQSPRFHPLMGPRATAALEDLR